MSTPNNYLVRILASTAMAFVGSSVQALEAGEAGDYTGMQRKLLAENQVEVLTAASGTETNVLGLKFFYSAATKTGYVAKTDSPGAPSQMKILLKMTEAKSYNPRAKEIDPSVAFIDSRPAIVKCDMLVNAGLAKAGECNSLNVNLETAKADGRMTFLQGKVGLNRWTAVVNTSTGRGNLFESTSEGATLIRLGFSDAEYLPKRQ